MKNVFSGLVFVYLCRVGNGSHALEARHPAESGYYNRLCLELAAFDTTLADSNPQAYEELVSTVREEYRKLDDGQKHLLYLLEFDPDDDEEFVTLEGLCHCIKEGMEELGWGLLQGAKKKGNN